MVMQPQVVRIMVIPVIADVPAGDLVAIRNDWTNGMTFGFDRMVPTSPKQKQNVTSIAKPRSPLMMMVHIIARGSVMEASWISSDIL